ncbi:MAG: peptidoglycan-binding protein LysM [Pirellulaceae bacterium]|nr:MAG: peptidoglycan-binding protein LysM [Pirellulaceae bacterium]
MDTIKTAAVVALLLAVLYGIYVVLTREEPAPPPEVAEVMSQFDEGQALAPPSIDTGTAEPSAPTSRPTDSEAGHSAIHGSPGEQPRIFVQVEPPADKGPASLPELPATNPARASAAPARTALASSDPPVAEQAPAPPPITPPWVKSSESTASAGELTGTSSNSQAGPTRLPPAAEGSASRYGSHIPEGSEHSNPNVQSPPAAGDTRREEPPFDNAPSQPIVVTSNSSSHDHHTAQASSVTSATQDTPKPRSDNSVERQAADTVNGLTEAIREARRLIDEGQYRDALQRLSSAYIVHQARAALNERQAALDLLDPLAAAVIYSRQHWLEPPYRVRVGQTLEQIATAYQVPVQLLQNINGISDPESLSPGTELKVLRGPFRAEVELSRNEMTLYVNDLYAGRFPISAGTDPSPIPGEYLVLNKQRGRTYYAADGRTLAPHDPLNPYGSVWLDLGVHNLSIHGSPKSGNPSPSSGCISLSPRDAEDVFAILSVGSRVTIRP